MVCVFHQYGMPFVGVTSDMADQAGENDDKRSHRDLLKLQTDMWAIFAMIKVFRLYARIYLLSRAISHCPTNRPAPHPSRNAAIPSFRSSTFRIRSGLFARVAAALSNRRPR